MKAEKLTIEFFAGIQNDRASQTSLGTDAQDQHPFLVYDKPGRIMRYLSDMTSQEPRGTRSGTGVRQVESRGSNRYIV